MLTIEKTNNKAILKFVSETILTKGSFEYNNIDDAVNSKLVQQLFYLPFIKKIFITANFIAIERYEIVEWAEVQEELNSMISNYLTTNGTLFNTDLNKKDNQKLAVQVYTESTPNPGVNKFVSNKFLSKQVIDVKKTDNLDEIPLAKALFLNFENIDEIFIVDNYVSIAKNKNIEWFEITNEVLSFIKTYLQEGNEVVTNNYIPKNIVGFKTSENNTPKLDTISKEIIAILDEYIKPAVTADGGNIMFQSYNKKSKVVEVVLQGACSGCPSSTVTLKNGIEATLKQILPNKINEVIAING
ncbi:MAG: NifU N-terminal domain-containing protein [Flavobacteriaceae bacterium]|nr:NifU N-terminal domain-containing protein [Flavobacteriaceae bacterium]